MPSRARDWFTQAQFDLGHATSSVENRDFEWTCFAAHQAAEKAVTAVFQNLAAQVIMGHAIHDMLAEFGRTLRVSARLLESRRVLDRHYIAPRYPNAHPSGAPHQHYTRTEATRAIRHADKIVRFCEGHLS